MKYSYLLFALPCLLSAQELTWPPQMPAGPAVQTLSGTALLKPHVALPADPTVRVAKTPPRVDFTFYPGQTYPGNPWSVWGDSLAVGDKYYSAIGDHMAPEGNAFVYEYDASKRTLKQIVDVRQTLKRPKGHYTPGKIHSRMDLGGDGWLYFSTHRGSTRTTTRENHFTGGWILRHHPGQGKTEVVAHAPLPMQTLPTSVLDPERLIFYAGTADGDYKNKRVQFLAYDLNGRKVLYSDNAGPYRYAIFARSTGKLYFQQEGGRGKVNRLVRFDPDKPGPPKPIAAALGLRAATQESRTGKVYTVDGDALWEFDTRSEQVRALGPTKVGSQTYIASIDLDPKTERYLYYVPGAHGGGERDGSPLIQYDLKTRTRKIIAFLRDPIHRKFGYIPQGTYGTAVSPEGDRVYITWNGNRGTAVGAQGGRIRFNTCALTVVHVPAAERIP